MISLVLDLIRALPILEKLVKVMFVDYEKWRAEYDEKRIKAKVSKSLVDNSATEINKEINK